MLLLRFGSVVAHQQSTTKAAHWKAKSIFLPCFFSFFPSCFSFAEIALRDFCHLSVRWRKIIIFNNILYVTWCAISAKKLYFRRHSERWNMSLGLLVNLTDINKTIPSQWNICSTSNLLSCYKRKCCITKHAFAKLHWCKNAAYTTIFFHFLRENVCSNESLFKAQTQKNLWCSK